MSMSILTVEAIRAADDLPTEVVEVPEWGGAVVVRGLSVADWVKLNKNLRPELSEEQNAAIQALLYGVVEPKFSPADVDWLVTKSLAACTRIVRVFNRLSGFNAGALAEARKNS